MLILQCIFKTFSSITIQTLLNSHKSSHGPHGRQPGPKSKFSAVSISDSNCVSASPFHVVDDGAAAVAHKLYAYMHTLFLWASPAQRFGDPSQYDGLQMTQSMMAALCWKAQNLSLIDSSSALKFFFSFRAAKSKLQKWVWSLKKKKQITSIPLPRSRQPDLVQVSVQFTFLVCFGFCYFVF